MQNTDVIKVLPFVIALIVVSAIGNATTVTAWLNSSNINYSEPIRIFGNATAAVPIDVCFAEIDFPNGTNQNVTMDLFTYNLEIGDGSSNTNNLNLFDPVHRPTFNYTIIQERVTFSSEFLEWYTVNPWGNSNFSWYLIVMQSGLSANVTLNDQFIGAFFEDDIGSTPNSFESFTFDATQVQSGENNFTIIVNESSFTTDWLSVGWDTSAETGESWGFTQAASQWFNISGGGFNNGFSVSFGSGRNMIQFNYTSDPTYFGDFNNTMNVGNFTITVRCNDTNDATDSSTMQLQVDSGTTVASTSFNSTTYESALETFRIDIDSGPTVSNIDNVTLYWDGLKYDQTTKTNTSNTWNFTHEVNIPLINLLNRTYPIAWTYTVVYTDSSTENISVSIPIETNYNFTLGSEYMYDTNLIRFEDDGIELLPINASDSDVTFISKYLYSSDATWSRDNGDLVPLALTDGAGWVSGGKLNTSLGYAQYNGSYNINSSIQVGAVGFEMTPSYSGTPLGDNKCFFSLTNETSNLANMISLCHIITTGNIQIRMYDKDGASITVQNLGIWNPTAGTAYDFELNWDVTTGATRLFIDGTQFGSTQTGTGTRDNNIKVLYVGAYYQEGLNNTDAIYDDFVVYDAVQHTSDFTVEEITVNYNNTSPSIEPINFINNSNVTMWTEFNTTELAPTFSNITYVLSLDNSTWQYWNGTAWNGSAGLSQSNLATIIDQNIETFPSENGTLYWRAYLTSEGNTTPRLEDINIKYANGNSSQFVAQGYELTTFTTQKFNYTELEIGNFYANVTKFENRANLSLNVSFNGTNTTCALYFNNTTLNQYNCTITMPTLTDGTFNVTFNATPHLNIQFLDRTRIDTTPLIENVTVFQVRLSNCTDGISTTTAVFFDFKDIQTDASLNASFRATIFANASHTRNYSFDWGDEIWNASLCIYPSFQTYSIDSVLITDSTGYAQNEYNLIRNINSTQFNQTIYLVNDSNDLVVTITVKEASGSTLTGVFVEILQFDAGTGNFTSLTKPSTDFDGQVVVSLIPNTVQYTFVVSSETETLGTFGPKIVTTSSITLTIGEVVEGEFFDVFGQFFGSCNFVSATGNLTCTYTDLTGTINQGCLNVIRYTIVNSTVQACNTCTSNTTIVCPLGNTTGRSYFYTLYLQYPESTYTAVTGFIGTVGGAFGDWGEFGLIAGILIIVIAFFIARDNAQAGLLVGGIMAVLFVVGIGLVTLDPTITIAIVVVVIVSIVVIRPFG